jgi:hypothetical protein
MHRSNTAGPDSALAGAGDRHDGAPFGNGMLRSLTAALAAAALSACVTSGGSPDPAEVQRIEQGLDQYLLVDCLLPGQIRRLGTMTTYVTPRRAVKSTRRDCEVRGGEYVLFDRSDYSAALTSLLPKAQAGDTVAQTYVGEIYEKGLGLPGPDYAKAASWYGRAAGAGYGPAQTSLGALYERGLGVPKDRLKALDLYRQAAGLDQDRLVFESELEQQRAAFRQELALRNRTAASLKQQLAATRRQLASAPKAPADTAAAARVSELKRAEAEQARALASQQADAKARAEQLKQEAQAAAELKAAEEAKDGGDDDARSKAAQAGKLELTRSEQYREALATANRLAGSP